MPHRRRGRERFGRRAAWFTRPRAAPAGPRDGDRRDRCLGKVGTDASRSRGSANTWIKPVGNRTPVACVEFTMAESFGVAVRGHFYDPGGAVRGVVVNRLMQVVALAGMEPAAGDG